MLLLKTYLDTPVIDGDPGYTQVSTIRHYFYSVNGQYLGSYDIKVDDRIDHGDANADYIIYGDGYGSGYPFGIKYNRYAWWGVYWGLVVASLKPASNVQQVSRTFPPPVPPTYVVKPGDTFPIIAIKLFGDSSYAGVIAQYNNLSEHQKPPVGKVLRTPPVIPVHNSVGVSTPYGQLLSIFIGSVYPHLEAPREHHDGFFGSLLEIIISVIAVAIAPYLAEFFPIDSVLFTSVMAGLADAAGQGILIGAGLEDDFSFAMVIETGFAYASSYYARALSVAGKTLTLENLWPQMFMQAKLNALEQLTEMSLGEKDDFDVRGIALAMTNVYTDAAIAQGLGQGQFLAQHTFSNLTNTILDSVVYNQDPDLIQLWSEELGVPIGQLIGGYLAKDIQEFQAEYQAKYGEPKPQHYVQAGPSNNNQPSQNQQLTGPTGQHHPSPASPTHPDGANPAQKANAIAKAAKAKQQHATWQGTYEALKAEGLTDEDILELELLGEAALPPTGLSKEASYIYYQNKPAAYTKMQAGARAAQETRWMQTGATSSPSDGLTAYEKLLLGNNNHPQSLGAAAALLAMGDPHELDARLNLKEFAKGIGAGIIGGLEAAGTVEDNKMKYLGRPIGHFLEDTVLSLAGYKAAESRMSKRWLVLKRGVESKVSFYEHASKAQSSYAMGQMLGNFGIYAAIGGAGELVSGAVGDYFAGAATRSAAGASQAELAGKVGMYQTKAAEEGVVVDSVSHTSKTFDLKPTEPLSKSRRQFQRFLDEVKKNGIAEPIKYVEHDGVKYVVNGHHRLRAAKMLGIEIVPVERVDLPYNGYQRVHDLFDYFGP